MAMPRLSLPLIENFIRRQSRSMAASTPEVRRQDAGDASPIELGHDDMHTKLIPKSESCALLEKLQLGARAGRCHRLPPLHALALTMGTHARLGSAGLTATPAMGGRRKSQHQGGKAPAAAADNSTGSAYLTMPGELVQRGRCGV